METIDTLQRIDDYVNQWMTPEERKQFESEIASNPELAREVAGIQEVAIAVREWNRQSKKAMLAEYERSLQHGSRGIFFSPAFKTISSIAATLLVVVTGWFMLRGNGFDDALPTNFAAVRGDASTADEVLLSSGAEQYEKKDWAAAAALLAQVKKESPLFAHSRVYLGICQLAQEKFAEARASFEQARFPDQNPLEAEARFYHGVACYKAGDKTCARTQFDAVLKLPVNEFTARAGANLKHLD